MPERKDEEYFKECFSKWLRTKCQNVTPVWERVPEDRQPPDYRLQLGDRKYAVKVTRIAKTSEITAQCSFNDIRTEIEDEARRTGVLKGFYILSFYPPVATSATLRKAIREKALHYISAHRGDEAANLQVIVPDDRDRIQRRVAIQKLGTGKDALICQPGAVCRIVDEVDTEIAPLVQAAVARKQRRFDEVGELSPRILLLGHDYPVPNLAVYEKCLSQLQAGGLLRDFAAVFLAITDAHGEMLYEAAGCFPSRRQQ
ncbi:hypothetical protein JXD38_10755 [candidate division WOR-3 bacterium]|nr:hypothetical protein [candidate division WOR-3 bacterium]